MKVSRQTFPYKGKQIDLTFPYEGKQTDVIFPYEGNKTDLPFPYKGKKTDLTFPYKGKKADLPFPYKGKKTDLPFPYEGKKADLPFPYKSKKTDLPFPYEGKQTDLTFPLGTYHSRSHFQWVVHSRDSHHSDVPWPPPGCAHWSARTPAELFRWVGRGRRVREGEGEHVEEEGWLGMQKCAVNVSHLLHLQISAAAQWHLPPMAGPDPTPRRSPVDVTTQKEGGGGYIN